MSHELRTPLHIIMGDYAAEILRDDTANVEPGERLWMLDRIYKAASENELSSSGGCLIWGVWVGKMPVNPRQWFCSSSCSKCSSASGSPSTRVALEWNVSPDRCDRNGSKLTVVLDNLINNAIKFTEVGKITASARRLPNQKIRLASGIQAPGIEATDPTDDIRDVPAGGRLAETSTRWRRPPVWQSWIVTYGCCRAPSMSSLKSDAAASSSVCLIGHAEAKSTVGRQAVSLP